MDSGTLMIDVPDVTFQNSGLFPASCVKVPAFVLHTNFYDLRCVQNSEMFSFS